jgi:hypothetical protein
MSRDDVISFFDQIAAQQHDVPRILLLDNAAIHKGEAMEKKRRAWAKQGFYLYYLPPYSPELNRIEILWKHAKYFWRRFTGLKGADLLDEVESLMDGFGSTFTINFALLLNLLGLALPQNLSFTDCPSDGNGHTYLTASQIVSRALRAQVARLPF